MDTNFLFNLLKLLVAGNEFAFAFLRFFVSGPRISRSTFWLELINLFKILHVVDEDPSRSLEQYTDAAVMKVGKGETALSDDAYDKKDGTYRQWRKDQGMFNISLFI